MKPHPASIYVVGAALLGVFALAAWGVLGTERGSGAERKLLLAAKRCGFPDSRIRQREGAYELNETDVSGSPNLPLTAEQKRNWDRIKQVKTKWMPCLERAAQAMGVRVTYEKMVIVN